MLLSDDDVDRLVNDGRPCSPSVAYLALSLCSAFLYALFQTLFMPHSFLEIKVLPSSAPPLGGMDHLESAIHPLPSSLKFGPHLRLCRPSVLYLFLVL